MSEFVDWQATYEALTMNCGVVELSEWSQIQISGHDRIAFLHNLCTNDIRRLEPGQSCEAFLTDVKGKIVAHVLVVATGEHLQLLTIPDQAAPIIAHLDRYIIREDVQLADVTDDYTWHYVIGPNAGDMTADAGELIVKSHLLWPGGFLVRVTSSELSPFISLPTTTTDSPAWNALRLESRLPLFATDFDESNLPQELDRDAVAISFTKGCYLGQETIARIDALGHVNKKLVLVKLSGEHPPEDSAKLLKEGQEVGAMTTCGWSPEFAGLVGLAFVRRGSNEIGARLMTEQGDAQVIAPLSAPL
jgi:folate-binding protein YgfZ